MSLVVGQVKTDPVTNPSVSRDIYVALTGDADNGLAPAAIVSSSTMRKLLGALLQAIATAIVNAVNSVTTGPHTDGQAVTWSSGVGPGQISFGSAAPNASLISASGCDEGGLISFNGGTNSTVGTVFTVHFKTTFVNPPTVVLFGANVNGATLLFDQPWYVVSDISSFQFVTPSNPLLSNITYSLYWVAKGSV